MIKAFLSHATADKYLVEKVQEKLTVEKAWYDAVNIENGESIPDKINEGLRQATHFVLFWSHVSSNSSWVKAEMNAAFVQMMAGKCKFMIFTLDDTILPALLQPYKYDRLDQTDLNEASQIIYEKILSQEGVASKLSEFIDRTDEIGAIEQSIRSGYKLIILNGILGIGKSALAEKAINWIYPNQAASRIILDFHIIPGIAELSIELSRQTKKPLINDNLSVEKQKENVRYYLEYITASNIILILKDVKNWLDEEGSPNTNLLFITDLIIDTEMFTYPTIMTTSRFIVIPHHYCEKTRQIPIRGMDEIYIAEIIKNNLLTAFQSNDDKNLQFAKRLYGYPLGAKIGAYYISNHGYDYYLNQLQKIDELKVGLAKDLISYANISQACMEYLRVVALSKSRLRNEEYIKAFPDLSQSIANLSDEAFFAGILKYDDSCYKLEPLVEDYFSEVAFNAPNRKELTKNLEVFLLDALNSNVIEEYMRLVPVAVYILTLNGKFDKAKALRSELTETMKSSMWDQYNHKEYEDALATAKGLLSDDETDRDALYVTALCLTRYDEYEKAEKILTDLIDEDDGNKARYYYALGRIQKRQANYEEAIEYFEIAVLKKRNYLSPYREMAECHIFMDDIGKAHIAIEKAKEIDNSNFFILLIQARLLQKENKLEEAIELLSKQSMLEKDPAQILFRKGRAYDQWGKKLDAKKCYEDALKYNSKAYDAKLCLLNIQIVDDPGVAKKDIAMLKPVLRGKRRHILTNIEARFIGYHNHDEAKALEILEGVPQNFRDKQWYAVKLQLLQNLIEGHKEVGRKIIVKEYSKEMTEVQQIFEKKYGGKSIIDADLIPDT